MSKNTDIEKENKNKDRNIDNKFTKDNKDEDLFDLILKSIAVAMGVSVLVLNILNTISVKISIMMLAAGLFTLSLSLIPPKK